MCAARVFAVTTSLLFLPGCAMFFATADRSGEPPFPSAPITEVEQKVDTGILRMAKLEASIISRPLNDARVRRLVWEELDESGLMTPEVRQRLNQSGFRIGVAGSSAPWALQSLANEAIAARRHHDSLQQADLRSKLSIGPAFTLMENGKSVLELQQGLNLDIMPLNALPELVSVRDRRDLRCVLEVSVKELCDDWVLLNILPQIHAGATAPRLSFSGLSEQLPVRQNIFPLYEHQFRVKLLSGEVAVIGYHRVDEWCVGKLFFQPVDGSSGSEQLLMIRMAGIDKLKGRSDPSFRLRSHAE